MHCWENPFTILYKTRKERIIEFFFAGYGKITLNFGSQKFYLVSYHRGDRQCGCEMKTCDKIMRVLPVFLTFISGIAPVLYWLMQNKGGKMPPGPLGLPILGYTLFISSEPHKQFRNLAEYYGPVFR